MAYIKVEHLKKNFPLKDGVQHVLGDVNFEIEKGEFICLLGFSGCGKSTILNILAGFEKPTGGTVTIGGEPVTGPSPRNIMIFQHYGLLPWKNVQKNVELGLETHHLKESERKEKAQQYIELVGLKGFENQFPAQLSGGQQQRVAIARGLAVNPECIFMDEPFGALDPIIRNKLQDDLLGIVKEQNKTVVFVTHDIEEAVYLADRVFVMKSSPGHIEKIYDIRLPKPRGRNTPATLQYRKKIYEKLYSIQEEQVEYVI